MSNQNDIKELDTDIIDIKRVEKLCRLKQPVH